MGDAMIPTAVELAKVFQVSRRTFLPEDTERLLALALGGADVELVKDFQVSRRTCLEERNKRLLALALGGAEPAAPAARSQAEGTEAAATGRTRRKRVRVRWQDAVSNLLLYARKHPRSDETQKQLCALAGGCSRNTLRKALGLDAENCPSIEALLKWYNTPGHKAPAKFYVHIEADLPEGLMKDMSGQIEDATAFLLDNEVDTYFTRIVALATNAGEKAQLRKADFATKRALVAATLANERYADKIT